MTVWPQTLLVGVRLDEAASYMFKQLVHGKHVQFVASSYGSYLPHLRIATVSNERIGAYLV